MKLATAIALGLLVAGCESAYALDNYGYDYGSDYNYEIVEDNVTLIAGHAFLTGTNGMTLYTFDNDDTGVSNCYDNCAANWPPYLAAANAVSPGNGFSIIDRNDGTRQWAKDGQPLYFWAGDQVPGDKTGDGVGGVWHIAR